MVKAWSQTFPAGAKQEELNPKLRRALHEAPRKGSELPSSLAGPLTAAIIIQWQTRHGGKERISGQATNQIKRY